MQTVLKNETQKDEESDKNQLSEISELGEIKEVEQEGNQKEFKVELEVKEREQSPSKTPEFPKVGPSD